MKQRIDDMESGTWFRNSASGDILVKLAGAVGRDSGTFQAVNIRTGKLECSCSSDCSPQLAQIEYEIINKTIT